MAKKNNPIQGVQVGDGNVQINKFGITDAKLAEQLGVAKVAVKNFLKILKQKHIPIEDWDHVLRQLAERYKELEVRISLLESDDPKVVSLQNQAKRAIAEAEFEKAEVLLKQAVDLDNAAAEKIKASFLKRKSSAAKNQGLIAKSMHARFALPEAIEAFLKAISLAEEGEDGEAIAEYQNGLGLAYLDCANYDSAIIFFEKSLNYYLVHNGEGSANVAIIWSNLGSVWQAKGEYDKAIEYFDKALASNLKTYEPGHPSVARDWNNLGFAWRDKGEYDKAIEYFDKALASNLKTFGPENPMVAIRWNNLGEAWRAKGEYDKAIEYFDKALASNLKTFGPENPDVLTITENLKIAKQASLNK
jgi:tetratricopeptide (TPR) repeat protein